MKRRLAIVIPVVAVLALLAVRAEAVRDAWQRALEVLRIVGAPVAATQPVLSDAEVEWLGSATYQQQAERLLERAVTGYEGATAYIETNVDVWRGEISETPMLRAMFSAATNHVDLRVRAAGIEVYLAAYGLEKTPAQVDELRRDLDDYPDRRVWTLYALGLLANRGASVDAVFETLLAYLDHDDVEMRHWAVEGMAYSGDERQIPEMLRLFRDDPSPRIQERAACSLAQSGMLPVEARLRAAPSILEIADDLRASKQTRRWAFQALRDISGESYGEDVARWSRWLRSVG